ncbi:hypothetical protein [Tellurirhabdus bombi]|uniref:hypothetical protein n=1 Tax=Tellurirhabdus bombi TaxID=2907205 RepID=UPI001F25310B|nr:hypothetical protein [Tellurirhabdus bombi]
MSQPIVKIPKEKAQFVGKSGAFYIINPVYSLHYTKYKSIEGYNDRSGLIGFVDAKEALADFAQEAEIDLSTLQATVK